EDAALAPQLDPLGRDDDVPDLVRARAELRPKLPHRARPLELRHEARPVRGVRPDAELERRPPESRLSRVTEQAQESVVDVQEAAVEARDRDGDRARAEGAGEALPLVAEGLLGPPSLGDVAEAPDAPDHAVAAALRPRVAL